MPPPAASALAFDRRHIAAEAPSGRSRRISLPAKVRGARSENRKNLPFASAYHAYTRPSSAGGLRPRLVFLPTAPLLRRHPPRCIRPQSSLQSDRCLRSIAAQPRGVGAVGESPAIPSLPALSRLGSILLATGRLCSELEALPAPRPEDARRRRGSDPNLSSRTLAEARRSFERRASGGGLPEGATGGVHANVRADVRPSVRHRVPRIRVDDPDRLIESVSGRSPPMAHRRDLSSAAPRASRFAVILHALVVGGCREEFSFRA